MRRFFQHAGQWNGRRTRARASPRTRALSSARGEKMGRKTRTRPRGALFVVAAASIGRINESPRGTGPYRAALAAGADSHILSRSLHSFSTGRSALHKLSLSRECCNPLHSRRSGRFVGRICYEDILLPLAQGGTLTRNPAYRAGCYAITPLAQSDRCCIHTSWDL